MPSYRRVKAEAWPKAFTEAALALAVVTVVCSPGAANAGNATDQALGPEVARSTVTAAAQPRTETSIVAPDDSTPAIKRALALLPRRPRQVGVVDAELETRPGVRKRLFEVDAFVSKGQPVVYLTRHSEVLKGAQVGSSIHVYMLAAIIWHEMAHLDGADEREAQKREESLWKRFVVDNRVDRVAALRYLKAMNDRHH